MGIPHDVVVRDILPKILGGMRGTTPEEIKNPEKAVKNIAFASLSESGDVYIQKAGEKAQNYKIKISPANFTEEKLKQNARKENRL
jgi:hypothetical protein